MLAGSPVGSSVVFPAGISVWLFGLPPSMEARFQEGNAGCKYLKALPWGGAQHNFLHILLVKIEMHHRAAQIQDKDSDVSLQKST